MDLITLYFKSNDLYKFNYSRKIPLNCSYKDKFSDIIDQYRIKSEDYDMNEKFYYNGNQINPMYTLEELFIAPFSIIEVMKCEQTIGGGLAMEFTDVSKNNILGLGFSGHGPSYRAICKGINIFGNCHCKKCSAYKKEVVIRIERGKLDLIKNKEDFFCPECGSYIKPKTVGFYQCKYSIYGKKYENGNIKDFCIIGEAKNTFNYYDPKINGETTVIELIFEILKYY